ncbi:MAG: hypothetical protein NWE95_07780 [Candidatus Bathyarchaeota archaeon]|nr:hypothetical protein [Candidatus Bathyarchaeota archaeon]
MKLRTIKLTPEFLVELLKGKAAPFTSNLPNDAELLDLKLDLFTKQVLAVVRSESFEDVAEGFPIPEFTFTTKKSMAKEVAQPAVTVAPEPLPLVAKQAPPPASDAALGVANEFSPEQRKLLSFSVRDDCVVIKPMQFLKAEWEDINEVVKSIGGRWVKGDIVSYWEVSI